MGGIGKLDKLRCCFVGLTDKVSICFLFAQLIHRARGRTQGGWYRV